MTSPSWRRTRPLARGLLAVTLLAAALPAHPAWADDDAPAPDSPIGDLATSDGERRRTVEVRVAPDPLDLAVRYRGAGLTLLQPGVAGALTVDLYRKEVTVENARHPRGFRHRTRTVHLGGEAGLSARVFGDLLFVAQGVVGTRMTRTSGLLTGPVVGLGISRSVLMHPSWRIARNGEARRGYLGGQTSIAASLGYELGWDLARRRETRIARGRDKAPLAGPLVLHMRPTLSLVAPWNTGLAWMVAWDVGLRAPLRRPSEETP